MLYVESQLFSAFLLEKIVQKNNHHHCAIEGFDNKKNDNQDSNHKES